MCKNGGGRPGSFYHVNDVSVYVGRQSGGRVLDRMNAFHTHVLRFEPGLVHVRVTSQTLKTPTLGAETTR